MIKKKKTYINFEDEEFFNRRTYTLLHEISHSLGAVDHYCYDINSNDCDNPGGNCYRCDLNTTKPNCVMSDILMTDLQTRLNNGTLAGIYCDICTSNTGSNSIVNHLNGYH